jgi:glycosyltransferase involved in cell wall biosynthesis
VPGLIEVTGSVPDVRPYLRDAAVVIVPLRVGGGTRLKVLEAMGMAKPIVATTVGAEGVALTHGKDALLVDAPDAFTSAVTAVLSDPAYAERLGRQARRLAEAQYGWDAIVSRLEALYEASRTGARPQAPMRSAVGVAR